MVPFILFVYGLYAGTFFSFSRFVFILSENQPTFVILSFCIVALYNFCHHDPHHEPERDIRHDSQRIARLNESDQPT